MVNQKHEDWTKPDIQIMNMVITKYGWAVSHPEKLKLGDLVDVGFGSYINSKYGVYIGDNVQIGSHCSIYSESTIDNKKGAVRLKKNCKVGTHSTIMPGVTIGENAIIGAYSFVTRNIPKNSRGWGIPCRIKYPYSK